MESHEEHYQKIEILLTLACNSQCIFCSFGENKPKTVKTMTEVESDLNFAIRSGARTVAFSGGEPTIAKILPEAISKAKQMGFEKIELSTNGRMLSYEDYAEKLVANGVTSFAVSLHSARPETNDLLVGAGNSFKQSVQGIRNLKKHGAHVVINAVAARHNYAEFPNLAKFAIENLGVDGLRLIMASPEGSAWKNAAQVLPRMSDAAAAFGKSINCCRNKAGEIWVYSIPPCLCTGFEGAACEVNLLKTQLRACEFNTPAYHGRMHGKVKFEKCSGCRFGKICEGVWEKYARLYGPSEFSPVKGKPVGSKKEFRQEFPMIGLKWENLRRSVGKPAIPEKQDYFPSLQ